MGFLRQLCAIEQPPATSTEAAPAVMVASGETETEEGIAMAGRRPVKAVVTRFPVGKDPKAATTTWVGGIHAARMLGAVNG